MIKLLVMDVDGTLTDGKIYMGSSGELMKAFNVKDGCGIKDILPLYDIFPVIITVRESDILENRCRELNIKHLYQGVRNKKEKLDTVIRELSKQWKNKLDYSNVAYIGDDLPDIECMRVIHSEGGIVGCPKDAANSVKDIADFVSRYHGGDGAVRDFIEWLIAPSDNDVIS